MASEKHIALSDYIKSIHQNLRREAQILGAEKAWENHCSEKNDLKRYATAMQDLAVNHWENNYKTNAKAVCRNNWTYEYCKHYFFEGELYRQREKEIEIANKINETVNNNLLLGIQNKLKLLDVGSCYNPFKVFDTFEVTAIDIAPANEHVFKCDFLNVDVGDKTTFENEVITCLQYQTYDVVVFSLLLEYLPSTKLRLLCCEKAYNLLKYEGLLVIITPDSKHVGANAQLIKSWRYVLSKIGFSRIKYEKLPHIHCMVFRKAISKLITQRWVDLHKDGQVFDEIFIPQDFYENEQPNTKSENSLDFNQGLLND